MISTFLLLFESLKVILLNMVTILVMPVKFVTLGFLISFSHEVTNKTLLRGSDYLVQLAI